MSGGTGVFAPKRALAAIAAFAALFITLVEDRARAAPGDVTASLVADINPGPDDSDPAGLNEIDFKMTNVNGTVYFIADDGTNGQELWKTDGTAATTEMIEAGNPGGGINDGSAGSDPQRLLAVNNALYFVANDGSNGVELWRTTPDSNTATMVEDGTLDGGLMPGAGSSEPSKLTAVGNTLYFVADGTNDGEVGTELWSTSGGEAGMFNINSRPEGDPNPDEANPFNLINVSGNLFFVADNGQNGFELWSTVNGLGMVSDLSSALMNPESVSTDFGTDHPAAKEWVAIGNELWFQARQNTDSSIGDELYRSDGNTITGIDVNPGENAPMNPKNSFPSEITGAGGSVYFKAFRDDVGTELFRTTGGGATLVNDANVGDGIQPGTGPSNPALVTAFEGGVVFQATDSSNGTEAWRATGDSAVMINGGLVPGLDSSNPGQFTPHNGSLYFSASDASPDTGLWRSEDGTTATKLTNGLAPNDITGVNGTVFFAGTNVVHGAELWYYDGTSVRLVEGATPGQGINPAPNPASSSIGPLTNVNGTLYFAAKDGDALTGADPPHGLELWKATIEGGTTPPPGGGTGTTPTPLIPITPAAGPTGQRAAALKKCKKKHPKKRANCRKKANQLPE